MENLIDPVIDFGKYRGQKKLSELDGGYLDFLMTKMMQGNPIVRRGLNWGRLAQLELQRRLTSSSTTAGVLYESAEMPLLEGSDAFMDMLGDLGEERKPSRPIQPGKDDTYAVTIAALDGVARHLLKEFIQRRDGNQSLSSWTAELAQEAVRYGQRGKPDIWAKEWTYLYLGKVFTIEWDEGKKFFGLVRIH